MCQVPWITGTGCLTGKYIREDRFLGTQEFREILTHHGEGHMVEEAAQFIEARGSDWRSEDRMCRTEPETRITLNGPRSQHSIVSLNSTAS